MTLHDVPVDGGAIERRRAARAYGAVVDAATTTIVASGRRSAGRARRGDVTVVRAVPSRCRPGRRAPARRTGPRTPVIGVLGFIYPGKGHAEVIDAVAAIDRDDIVVTAIGRSSDGHGAARRPSSPNGPDGVAGGW